MKKIFGQERRKQNKGEEEMSKWRKNKTKKIQKLGGPTPSQ